jgi:hypothetical protein
MAGSRRGAMNKAVRTVERWGLLAAVTGIVSNALLLALFTVAQRNSSYEWTGPANDVIGAVSSGATIPVALALVTVLGETPALRLATRLAVGAMALIVALSLALVSGLIPFVVQGAAAGVVVVAMFGWVLVVGRTGRATGRLPGRLGRAAEVIGAAALVATPLVGLSLLLPAGSIPQYLVGGAGLLLAVPAFAAFPVWLLLVSNRLREHLAEREARAPELSTVI